MAVIEERKGRNGEPVYRVKIRVKGRPQESQTFEKKKDAKEWAQIREGELRKEAALGVAAFASRSLGQLIDRYIRDELPKREIDQNKVRMHLEWWKSELGDVQVRDLTVSRLSAARDKLLRTPNQRNAHAPNRTECGLKSPATVVRYMASLSHALTVAEKEWEWLASNPMHKVKRPKLPTPNARFLSDDECARLLEACRSSSCDFLYAIVVLALSTGARYSEIMHLRWRDIDLDRGVARVEKTKNNEKRALPLTHKALEVMTELHRRTDPDKRDYVFPRRDGLAPKNIRKSWEAALRAAEIENFRFHDLRHTAASYLAMNGATLAEIAEVLGHKTLQMVKRYAHLSDQHTAAVVERMNRAIFKEPANDNDEVIQETDAKEATD
ncbi:site-specific integrase [uncultured Parvibaculum sp.]|uniref:tyrosine-type recombinase/integrase n=1 Tax=uncultured Parvibaculum sp. TaxID=291828 RepID=UPI0030D6E66E|tara:strand:- start:86454 stop:87602 length:1149 start_codon:yes stop_codon:yes gene_type:complete